MSNTEEKSLTEHFDDFKDGLYKTFIETPIDFGDFLARVSGVRDYQLYDSVIDLGNPIQTQAILELRAVYEVITTPSSLSYVAKILWEDVQERPMYYIGSSGSQIGIGKTILIESSPITQGILKTAYSISDTGTKIDSAAHQNFENAKDILKMTDGEFNTYVANTIDNIDLFKNNEGTIFDYIKEAGIDKVKIGDETYTIQKDNPLFLNNQNTHQLEIVNPITNEKTVYSVDTNNNNNLTAEYKTDLTTGSIVSLKSGQTISHIAANTEFKTMDLLKYNNLTLEQAKNLPVGYEIEIPKSIENFDGGYGNIKLYTAYDGTLTYYIPDDKGNVNVIKINSDGEILQNDFDISGTVLDEITVTKNDNNQSYNDSKTMEELLKDPNNLVKIDDGILYADSGQIKTDVNYDKDSQTLFYEDENGNIQELTYDDNSNLLIYGDPNNPNKTTFTDENGDYQVWEKDNEGNFEQTNKVDYSGVLNTAINQIGNLIIMNNQDFSNVEKIVVSTSVATIADFATYKGTEFNTTIK